MIRLSKQSRSKAARYIRGYGGLADLFIARSGQSTWKIQFGSWNEETDQITQVAWCFPKDTPRSRILGVRDAIVKALEGDFRALNGGEFPEHCAGMIHTQADMAKLRWELLNAVHERNAADKDAAVNVPVIGGAA